MTTCQHRGADAQDDRFGTRCGAAVAETASPAVGSVHPIWFVRRVAGPGAGEVGVA